MSDTKTTARIGFGGFGLGVFWALWGVHGFFWALVYGFFWPVWAGYHFAKWMVTL